MNKHSNKYLKEEKYKIILLNSYHLRQVGERKMVQELNFFIKEDTLSNKSLHGNQPTVTTILIGELLEEMG